jgi:hypothetical protein
MKLLISAFILLALTACKKPIASQPSTNIQDKITACTTEVKDCGDGKYVSRDPDQSCQFQSCPETSEGTSHK